MAHPAAVPPPALGPELRAVLDLERAWAAAPAPKGSKERFVRERLGLTPARYAAALQRALDHPGAVAYDAATVRRLLRLREQGRRRLRGPALRSLE
ncbi:MAG: DUF3263 domain-containing protein [Actinomycetota bacterium]